MQCLLSIKPLSLYEPATAHLSNYLLAISRLSLVLTFVVLMQSLALVVVQCKPTGPEIHHQYHFAKSAHCHLLDVVIRRVGLASALSASD